MNETPVIGKEAVVRWIAQICIVEERSVSDAVTETGLPQDYISRMKNTHECYDYAFEILATGYKTVMERIPKYKVKDAVRLSVEQMMTNREIDNELSIREGTTLMLTRTPMWKVEKQRLTTTKKGFQQYEKV